MLVLLQSKSENPHNLSAIVNSKESQLQCVTAEFEKKKYWLKFYTETGKTVCDFDNEKDAREMLRAALVGFGFPESSLSDEILFVEEDK